MLDQPASSPRAALRPSTSAHGWPLLGVLPGLVRDAPATLQRVARAHPGEVVKLRLGPVVAYLATDPEHAQYILADNWRNFSKESGMWRGLQRLLGDGLATTSGDTWLLHRRLLQPLFTVRSLAAIVDRMVRSVDADVERLVRRVDAGAPVDLAREMMQMTQRVLLETMFGTSIQVDEADTLAGSILAAFTAINTRMFLYFVPDRLMPGERALQLAIARLDGTVLRMVRERRAEGEAGAARGDLLALLLGARDGEGATMDDRQLRDELVTMFIAGNETTAVTMTWLFYLLDRHPEVDRKVRAEIDAVLGDRLPTSADLERLVYCKQVIQETMRLYPPSWIIPRLAREADQIGGYAVPAGANVIMSQYVLHHDPRFWESPSAFDPERFAPERAGSRPRYAYMPFGGGPRQCIGNMFAIFEGQVILALLRRRLRLRVVPGHAVVAKAAITLRPRDGLPVTLHAD